MRTTVPAAQFGGQVTDYEHGLSFVTVHGSGHMVPTFRPRAALTLLRHVVENSTFAPPVPSDAALAAMGGPEFDGFLTSGWRRRPGRFTWASGDGAGSGAREASRGDVGSVPPPFFVSDDARVVLSNTNAQLASLCSLGPRTAHRGSAIVSNRT